MNDLKILHQMKGICFHILKMESLNYRVWSKDQKRNKFHDYQNYEQLKTKKHLLFHCLEVSKKKIKELSQRVITMFM